MNMGDGFSVGVYTFCELSIPIAVYMVTLFAVVLNAHLILPCCFVKNKYYEHYMNLHVIYSKLMFPGALEIKNKPRRILFHGYEISEQVVLNLSVATSFMIGTVFLCFWGTFFIERTFVCDPQLDCFFSNSSSLFVTPVRRLDNCNYVDDNAIVTCYQFVFNIAGGLASAVGFLAITVFYLYVYENVVLWLIELFFSPKSGGCVTCCSFVGCAIMLFAPFIFHILSLFIIANVPFFSDIHELSMFQAILHIPYMFCFVVMGPYAGRNIISVVYSHMRDERLIKKTAVTEISKQLTTRLILNPLQTSLASHALDAGTESA